MRVIPETYIVEGADVQDCDRRQHRLLKMPRQLGLPGTLAHIESLGTTTEQERQKRQPPFGRGGCSDARGNRSQARHVRGDSGRGRSKHVPRVRSALVECRSWRKPNRRRGSRASRI